MFVFQFEHKYTVNYHFYSLSVRLFSSFNSIFYNCFESWTWKHCFWVSIVILLVVVDDFVLMCCFFPVSKEVHGKLSSFFSFHVILDRFQLSRSVPQIRIDVKGYLTLYFLINRVKSKLKGFSDCFHSHNLK